MMINLDRKPCIQNILPELLRLSIDMYSSADCGLDVVMFSWGWLVLRLRISSDIISSMFVNSLDNTGSGGIALNQEINQ